MIYIIFIPCLLHVVAALKIVTPEHQLRTVDLSAAAAEGKAQLPSDAHGTVAAAVFGQAGVMQRGGRALGRAAQNADHTGRARLVCLDILRKDAGAAQVVAAGGRDAVGLLEAHAAVVHQKAQDRAQQRVTSPPLSDIRNTPGSPQVTGNMAFASERERAKEALRTELNNYSSNNIHKIAALTQTTDDGRILRVAAYCRVSTDDEDQVSSMELQKKAYKELITNNPNWVYYGTFVDDGYSGKKHGAPPRLPAHDEACGAGQVRYDRDQERQ